MAPNVKGQANERLRLRTDLSQIAQVHPWIQRLASQYAIPDSVQFASNLCLEEVLSNIMLHGYDGKLDGAVVVCFSTPGDRRFLFVVEDEAPHFNPLDQPELAALNPNEESGLAVKAFAFFTSSPMHSNTNSSRSAIVSKCSFQPVGYRRTGEQRCGSRRHALYNHRRSWRSH